MAGTAPHDQSRPFGEPGRNRLLSGLPSNVELAILARMDKVSLMQEQVLYAANTPVNHVWFLLSGMVSLMVTMNNDATAEVATVGNEGFVGTAAYLGAGQSLSQALCQVTGHALKMRLDVFRQMLDKHPEFHAIVGRYIEALMGQMAQSTACNHIHTLEQRMCRWLLMTHDRVGTDELNLTQEFLAEMLAVRRPTVTVCAGILQKAGLIQNQRGRIRVVDRANLEARSCECYGVIRAQFNRLLA